MKKFIVINGPNLNMLGRREPELYGALSLDDICQYTKEQLSTERVELDWFQFNSEAEIVQKIHQLDSCDYVGLIINPAAFSHTSVAILDALKLVSLPIAEVHITNTHQRESFRQNKLTAKASTVVIEGAGKNAYYLGVLALLMR